MAKAILFDFNGVIVNDEPQHCDALIATLATYDYPLDRDTYYRDYLGFDDRECFRFTFERMGRPLTATLMHEAIERKAEKYEAAIRASMELVPGSADFIRQAAREGIRMVIVSGALRREIELVLGASGLRQHFETLVASEDVDACKPDPQGFRKGLAAIGLPARDCVVIEDSRPGMLAARAAGLRVAMLTTSHPAEELREGDVVWETLAGHTPSELPWAR